MAGECSCIYVDCDDGSTIGFHKREDRKARKRHTCCECGDQIKPGDKYEYVSGVWEGDWGVYKTCATCREIRKALFCHGWYYGRLYCDVREYLHDGGEIGCDCLAAMSKPARDTVCDIIQEFWEETAEKDIGAHWGKKP